MAAKRTKLKRVWAGCYQLGPLQIQHRDSRWVVTNEYGLCMGRYGTLREAVADSKVLL